MRGAGIAQFVRGFGTRSAWTNAAAVTNTSNPVAQE